MRGRTTSSPAISYPKPWLKVSALVAMSSRMSHPLDPKETLLYDLSVLKQTDRRHTDMFSFGIILSLKARSKDRLELSLSLGFRLLFAFFFIFFCFLFLSGALSGDQKTGGFQGNILLLVLACIMGLGALYNERWIFDRRENVFENHFGLIILCRKQSIPLSELVRVELNSFIKGRVGNTQDAQKSPGHTDSGSPSNANLLRSFPRGPQRQILRLTVLDSRGKPYVLDTAKAHRIEDLRRIGRRIADFCAIPFREN